MAILSLSLIQVGQLSATGERIFTKNWLTAYVYISLHRKSVVRLTDRLDMTIVVDWDVKPQMKQTNTQKDHSPLTELLPLIIEKFPMLWQELQTFTLGIF